MAALARFRSCVALPFVAEFDNHLLNLLDRPSLVRPLVELVVLRWRQHQEKLDANSTIASEQVQGCSNGCGHWITGRLSGARNNPKLFSVGPMGTTWAVQPPHN